MSCQRPGVFHPQKSQSALGGGPRPTAYRSPAPGAAPAPRGTGDDEGTHPGGRGGCRADQLSPSLCRSYALRWRARNLAILRSLSWKAAYHARRRCSASSARSRAPSAADTSQLPGSLGMICFLIG